MKQFLIDTDICIYFMKGMYELDEKFNKSDVENIYISIITLAELKFGVANSQSPLRNQRVLDNFLTDIWVLPLFKALDMYAIEKSRLRKIGRPIDDFDLFIGCTAVAYDLTLVTNNTRHFESIENLKLENWVI